MFKFCENLRRSTFFCVDLTRNDPYTLLSSLLIFIIVESWNYKGNCSFFACPIWKRDWREHSVQQTGKKLSSFELKTLHLAICVFSLLLQPIEDFSSGCVRNEIKAFCFYSLCNRAAQTLCGGSYYGSNLRQWIRDELASTPNSDPAKNYICNTTSGLECALL